MLPSVLHLLVPYIHSASQVDNATVGCFRHLQETKGPLSCNVTLQPDMLRLSEVSITSQSESQKPVSLNSVSHFPNLKLYSTVPLNILEHVLQQKDLLQWVLTCFEKA